MSMVCFWVSSSVECGVLGEKRVILLRRLIEDASRTDDQLCFVILRGWGFVILVVVLGVVLGV